MGDYTEEPLSGRVPYVIGQASVVRIPVPNTGGLCVEFRPRGHVPAGGSTSTVFIQDPVGKRQLRLDYGYNIKTKTIDYHWNQKGTFKSFGIVDHAPVSKAGGPAYQAAKYFRYAGRVLFIAGIAVDTISIAQATRPLRRASEVVVGWAAAWVGCKAGGAAGSAVGTATAPGPGTVVGGVLGCVIGGYGGYRGGTALGGEVYDWGEGVYFAQLPVVAGP